MPCVVIKGTELQSSEPGSELVNDVSASVDIQVKELDKRASGQAFEVLLSPTSGDSKGDFPLTNPKKKDVSLEEIQRKLDAAEERRKVWQTFCHLPVILVHCSITSGIKTEEASGLVHVIYLSVKLQFE